MSTSPYPRAPSAYQGAHPVYSSGRPVLHQNYNPQSAGPPVVRNSFPAGPSSQGQPYV